MIRKYLDRDRLVTSIFFVEFSFWLYLFDITSILNLIFYAMGNFLNAENHLFLHARRIFTYVNMFCPSLNKFACRHAQGLAVFDSTESMAHHP